MRLSDQDYCLLDDGSILAVHGDQDDDAVFGDIAFVPDPGGPYRFRGSSYSKAYSQNQKGRATLLTSAIDALAVDRVRNPSNIRVSTAHVQEVLRTEDSLAEALSGSRGRILFQLMEFVAELVPAVSMEGSFGLTGSVALDPHGTRQPHDWDLVLTLPVEGLTDVCGALQQRARSQPGARVYEYGKGWLIRQWVHGELLCPFFRLAGGWHVQIHPAQTADTELVSGVVVQSGLSVLVPGFIEVDAPSGPVEVLLMGLRYRGDFARGDRVSFVGEWRQASINGSRRKAFVVFDETQRPLQDPPWRPYYD